MKNEQTRYEGETNRQKWSDIKQYL